MSKELWRKEEGNPEISRADNVHAPERRVSGSSLRTVPAPAQGERIKPLDETARSQHRTMLPRGQTHVGSVLGGAFTRSQ